MLTSDVVPISSDVCSWPDSDMPRRLLFDRFRGQSGSVVLGLSLSAFDPGCVKKAPYRHRAQNAAGIRIAERKFSWNPFSERP